jgi:hypothetical protein
MGLELTRTVSRESALSDLQDHHLLDVRPSSLPMPVFEFCQDPDLHVSIRQIAAEFIAFALVLGVDLRQNGLKRLHQVPKVRSAALRLSTFGCVLGHLALRDQVHNVL